MRWVWWLVILNIFHVKAYAFVAGEIKPGLIRLRSEVPGGLVVDSVSVKKRGHKSWLYFCVESKGTRLKQRCFYARQKKFAQIRTGKTIESIEYSLSPRVHNKYGRIAIGSQRYFYPLSDLGPLGP